MKLSFLTVVYGESLDDIESFTHTLNAPKVELSRSLKDRFASLNKICKSKPSVVIWEYPEYFVSARNQIKVVNRIIDTAYKNNINVVVVTDSMYVLRSAEVLMQSYKNIPDELRLYLVEGSEVVDCTSSSDKIYSSLWEAIQTIDDINNAYYGEYDAALKLVF